MSSFHNGNGGYGGSGNYGESSYGASGSYGGSGYYGGNDYYGSNDYYGGNYGGDDYYGGDDHQGRRGHRGAINGSHGGSSRTGGCGTSFLFVVNKLKLRNSGYRPDRWGNVFPLIERQAYGQEDPSGVMRYQDGRVTSAEGYSWRREGPGQPGYIACSHGAYTQPTKFMAQTVFACSPFLPIVVADGDTTACDVDTTVSDGDSITYDENQPDPDQPPLKWSLLHFDHDSSSPGISFAAGRGSGRPYVTGANPSWMPGLVPLTYQNLYSPSSRSRGLGGELPLLLALMSFWERWSTPHETRMRSVFLGPNAHWQDRKWRVPRGRSPQGYPRIEEKPRGFFVQVCLDDLDNPASTHQTVEELERTVLVEE